MKIQITATTAKEFQQVEDIIKKFPTWLQNRLVSASINHMTGISFVINADSGGDVILPLGVTQISIMGEYYACYHPDYFFKAPRDAQSFKFWDLNSK